MKKIIQINEFQQDYQDSLITENEFCIQGSTKYSFLNLLTKFLGFKLY